MPKILGPIWNRDDNYNCWQRFTWDDQGILSVQQAWPSDDDPSIIGFWQAATQPAEGATWTLFKDGINYQYKWDQQQQRLFRRHELDNGDGTYDQEYQKVVYDAEDEQDYVYLVAKEAEFFRGQPVALTRLPVGEPAADSGYREECTFQELRESLAYWDRTNQYWITFTLGDNGKLQAFKGEPQEGNPKMVGLWQPLETATGFNTTIWEFELSEDDTGQVAVDNSLNRSLVVHDGILYSKKIAKITRLEVFDKYDFVTGEWAAIPRAAMEGINSPAVIDDNQPNSAKFKLEPKFWAEASSPQLPADILPNEVNALQLKIITFLKAHTTNQAQYTYALLSLFEENIDDRMDDATKKLVQQIKQDYLSWEEIDYLDITQNITRGQWEAGLRQLAESEYYQLTQPGVPVASAVVVKIAPPWNERLGASVKTNAEWLQFATTPDLPIHTIEGFNSHKKLDWLEMALKYLNQDADRLSAKGKSLYNSLAAQIYRGDVHFDREGWRSVNIPLLTQKIQQARLDLGPRDSDTISTKILAVLRMAPAVISLEDKVLADYYIQLLINDENDTYEYVRAKAILTQRIGGEVPLTAEQLTTQLTDLSGRLGITLAEQRALITKVSLAAPAFRLPPPTRAIPRERLDNHLKQLYRIPDHQAYVAPAYPQTMVGGGVGAWRWGYQPNASVFPIPAETELYVSQLRQLLDAYNTLLLPTETITTAHGIRRGNRLVTELPRALEGLLHKIRIEEFTQAPSYYGELKAYLEQIYVLLLNKPYAERIPYLLDLEEQMQMCGPGIYTTLNKMLQDLTLAKTVDERLGKIKSDLLEQLAAEHNHLHRVNISLWGAHVLSEFQRYASERPGGSWGIPATTEITRLQDENRLSPYLRFNRTLGSLNTFTILERAFTQRYQQGVVRTLTQSFQSDLDELRGEGDRLNLNFGADWIDGRLKEILKEYLDAGILNLDDVRVIEYNDEDTAVTAIRLKPDFFAKFESYTLKLLVHQGVVTLPSPLQRVTAAEVLAAQGELDTAARRAPVVPRIPVVVPPPPIAVLPPVHVAPLPAPARPIEIPVAPLPPVVAPVLGGVPAAVAAPAERGLLDRIGDAFGGIFGRRGPVPRAAAGPGAIPVPAQREPLAPPPPVREVPAHRQVVPEAPPPPVQQPAVAPVAQPLPAELQRLFLAKPGANAPLVNAMSLAFARAVSLNLFAHREQDHTVKQFLTAFKNFHPNFVPATLANLKEWLKHYSSPSDVEVLLYPVMNKLLAPLLTSSPAIEQGYKTLFGNQIAQCFKAVNDGQPLPDNAFAHLSANGQPLLQTLLANPDLQAQVAHLTPANDADAYKNQLQASINTMWGGLWQAYRGAVDNHQHPWNLRDLKLFSQFFGINLKVWDGKNLSVECGGSLSFMVHLNKKDGAFQVYLADQHLATQANDRNAAQNRITNLPAYYAGTAPLPAPAKPPQPSAVKANTSTTTNPSSQLVALKPHQASNIKQWAARNNFEWAASSTNSNNLTITVPIGTENKLDIKLDISGNKVVLDQPVKDFSAEQRKEAAIKMLEAYIQDQCDDGKVSDTKKTYFEAAGELAKELNQEGIKMGLTPASERPKTPLPATTTPPPAAVADPVPAPATMRA